MLVPTSAQLDEESEHTPEHMRVCTHSHRDAHTRDLYGTQTCTLMLLRRRQVTVKRAAREPPSRVMSCRETEE